MMALRANHRGIFLGTRRRPWFRKPLRCLLKLHLLQLMPLSWLWELKSEEELSWIFRLRLLVNTIWVLFTCASFVFFNFAISFWLLAKVPTCFILNFALSSYFFSWVIGSDVSLNVGSEVPPDLNFWFLTKIQSASKLPWTLWKHLFWWWRLRRASWWS